MKSLIPIGCVVFFLILSLSAHPTLAATIHVPADYTTIQGAIVAAVDGDLVLVAPRTYVENIDFLGKEVTLQSEGGADVTIIDGGDCTSGEETCSVVTFDKGETEAANLDGFTIWNGVSKFGGGIYCESSSPTITHCTIRENRAVWGGGISCISSSPTIAHCKILGNYSSTAAGGIYGRSSSPTITDCEILGNIAADTNGGGIYCLNDFSTTITNCIISGNSADYRAGGILCSGSTTRITNCTVSENIAGDHGGGICCTETSSLIITNCIVRGNYAPGWPEISVVDSGSSVLVTYSDVQGGWEGEENIDEDPLFVGDGDYHLILSSPCIDSGTDAGVYTDVDGEVRPLGSGFDMGADEYPNPGCQDGDMDGFGDVGCGGYDCDDSAPEVNPGMPEICDNGIDDDCDGLIDYPDDSDCEFILDLDASYESGILSLDFTISTLEPATWANYVILTDPTVQIIPLWTVPLPVIYPPFDIPIAFPFPILGLVGIWTDLFTTEGKQAVELVWVETRRAIQIQSNLPDTGITHCYDYTQWIPYPAPGEPFYGQDGQYVTNPMSFTDNGDGTVTDNVTGLMWQQEDDDDSRDWYEAIDYCEALNLAGYTAWRLPDEYELQGIIDYGRYYPAIDTVYFPNTNSSSYWSSSTHAWAGGGAWSIASKYGDVACSSFKYNPKYVRCMRGAKTSQSFTDHGDGTVTDNVTGIMWQQEDDDLERDWEDALAYCESLDLAGQTDWRLPDIKEMRSIVDNTRYDPAIDPIYFPGTNLSSYWSSSTHAYLNYYAWGVTFHAGGVYSTDKGDPLSYVRCAR